MVTSDRETLVRRHSSRIREALTLGMCKGDKPEHCDVCGAKADALDALDALVGMTAADGTPQRADAQKLLGELYAILPPFLRPARESEEEQAVEAIERALRGGS